VPQYVIEREIPGAGNLTEAQIQQASLKSLEVLDELGSKIRWLHSYVTDDKIYCVYLAPDEATVREHAKRVGMPANRVAAVRRLLDPVNYRE
jgi:Nickel responsive protein SCO4226-like